MKRNLLRKRKGWVPVNFLHCQSRLAPKTTVASIWRHIPRDFRLPISNMAASRLEINFIRLLSRCEAIASEKRQETEWRLEKVNWMKCLCCNSCSCRWFLTLICVLEFFSQSESHVGQQEDHQPGLRAGYYTLVFCYFTCTKKKSLSFCLIIPSLSIQG